MKAGLDNVPVSGAAHYSLGRDFMTMRRIGVSQERISAARRRARAALFEQDVAGGVGFIALAGVSAEVGVIMLLYLKQAWARRLAAGQGGDAALRDAIREGAVLRVRPTPPASTAAVP